MKCGSVKQKFTVFLKERAVCCYDDFETELVRYIKQLKKVRVQKRLTHQVKIEIFTMRSYFFCRMLKLRHAHKARRTFCFMAKTARKIADISYFKISFFQHVKLQNNVIIQYNTAKIKSQQTNISFFLLFSPLFYYFTIFFNQSGQVELTFALLCF